MIDFAAREVHFLDHLAPVWSALPAELRGQFFIRPNLARHAASAGIRWGVSTAEPTDDPDRLTVCASWGDLKRVRRAGRRRVILAEHGAGQTYVGASSNSYLGAPDRAGVVAVLVPGPRQAAAHHAVHPEIPAFPIGVPKLDRLHREPLPLAFGRPVAVSFHWDCRVCPETRTGWSHFRGGIPSLVERFDRVIGHGHPRILSKIAASYVRDGADVITRFSDVCDVAGVYAVDNSSTLFEFASLDRPVVVLNPPRYRRSVDHGMRFWEYADVGVQCSHPREFANAVEEAIADRPEVRQRRREVVAEVYGPCDGLAAQRASEAIMEVSSWPC